MHCADPLAASLCPQFVRLRTFTQMRCADPLAASLHPQDVRPLVHSPKCTVLTLLRPRSALRMYVLSYFHLNALC